MTFKICMIEDDSDLANIVREHLIRYDFEVFICEDFKSIDKFIEKAGLIINGNDKQTKGGYGQSTRD